jgi:hypothetical protein
MTNRKLPVVYISSPTELSGLFGFQHDQRVFQTAALFLGPLTHNNTRLPVYVSCSPGVRWSLLCCREPNFLLGTIFLEDLIVCQLDKKLSAFYEALIFFTVFSSLPLERFPGWTSSVPILVTLSLNATYEKYS